MHTTNINTQPIQKPATLPNLATEIAKTTIQELFNNKKEEEPKEEDLFESMEKFLNEPYEKEKEEEKSSPVSELCANLLIKGFFNYIKQNSNIENNSQVE